MRFNKCHRPQVGDVLAPQTRLQGVRFPLDFDNSAPPSIVFSSRVLLTSRIVGRASVSCSNVRALRARNGHLLSTLRFVRSPNDGRKSNHCGWWWRPSPDPTTKILYSETWTRGREHGTNVGWNYSNPWRTTHDYPLSPVSPVEPSCRSMLFNRRAKVTVWKEH